MKRPCQLSNQALLARVISLTKRTDALEAQLIGHLAEVIARGLHEELGLRSVFSYVTTVLGFSRDVAHRRIRAARAVIQKPEAITHLQEGRLTVSSLAALAPAIQMPNALNHALGKSKREVENMVAFMRSKKSPRSDGTFQVTGAGPAAKLLLSPTLRKKIAIATSLKAAAAQDGSRAENLSGPVIIECALDHLIASLEESSEEQAVSERSVATSSTTPPSEGQQGTTQPAPRSHVDRSGNREVTPQRSGPRSSRMSTATAARRKVRATQSDTDDRLERGHTRTIDSPGDGPASSPRNNANSSLESTAANDRVGERPAEDRSKRQPFLPLVAAWLARGLRETTDGLLQTTEGASSSPRRLRKN